MGWDNVDTTLFNRMFAEFYSNNPIKFKNILIYNTNTVATIAAGLVKPIMPPKMRRALHLGCQIEFDFNPYNRKLTLADIYLQPDYDNAMQRLLQRARTLLQQRLQYHEDFELGT